MDSFSSFFQSHSSSRSRWSYDSLKNFRQISPVVQKYLKQVYLMLCCALIASAVGVYMHLLWYIGDFLTTVGCIGSMIWLLSTPPYEEVTTPLLFKLIPAVVHLGVLLGWFSPDGNLIETSTSWTCNQCHRMPKDSLNELRNSCFK